MQLAERMKQIRLITTQLPHIFSRLDKSMRRCVVSGMKIAAKWSQKIPEFGQERRIVVIILATALLISLRRIG